MPLPAAVPVTLTAAGRKTLKKRARGAKPGRAGRPAPVWAAAADQRGGPGGRGRAGVPAAGRDRGAAVPLDRPGAGRRAGGAGPGQRADVGDVAAADPGGESGQTVAVPVLDLSPLCAAAHSRGYDQSGTMPSATAEDAAVDHPGKVGGSDTWEDSESWRHSGSIPRSCVIAR